jgi:hypothetical protein
MAEAAQIRELPLTFNYIALHSSQLIQKRVSVHRATGNVSLPLLGYAHGQSDVPPMVSPADTGWVCENHPDSHGPARTDASAAELVFA